MALDKAAHALSGIEGYILSDQSRHGRYPVAFPWSISISRQGGIDTQPIVDGLKQRLGWESFDRELITHVADEMGASPAKIREFDESGINFFADFAASFGLNDQISESEYVHNLFRVIWNIASKKHAIFIGRGSSHILPAQSTLRVLLIAPFDERVVEVQRRMHYSNADAIAHVRRLDSERKQFGSQFLNSDIFDPVRYDLVINPLRLGGTGTAATIVCAVSELQRIA